MLTLFQKILISRRPDFKKYQSPFKFILLVCIMLDAKRGVRPKGPRPVKNFEYFTFSTFLVFG